MCNDFGSTILCVVSNVTSKFFCVVLTQHWLLYYVRIGLLMVCCTMLFLFFASGIYADRITAAKKYVHEITIANAVSFRKRIGR